MDKEYLSNQLTDSLTIVYDKRVQTASIYTTSRWFVLYFINNNPQI